MSVILAIVTGYVAGQIAHDLLSLLDRFIVPRKWWCAVCNQFGHKHGDC
jgi:hypothetical protein